jgi:hypothetical protein
MDSTEHLRTVIMQVLTEYSKIPYAYGEVQPQTVFDKDSDNYLLLAIGWNKRRVHGIVAHLQIIDGKVWIQRDGTEYGFAKELEDLGVSKSQIVLGFHPPDVRPHTEYAVA